jgi:hypothetical protein
MTRRRKKHRPDEIVAKLRDKDAMPNAGTGSVRHAARGQGAHRAMAAALQHDPAAQHPGVTPPGSRGDAALCGWRAKP